MRAAQRRKPTHELLVRRVGAVHASLGRDEEHAAGESEPLGVPVAVETGDARGWTRETYPFHDAPPQGYEALALPWEGPRRTVWRWSGSSMARVP